MPSAIEWLIAWRYLRARRQEGFISVVAWFSLIGIALGVATLIIVMSVMNGFRAELIGRILGLNGHVTIKAQFDDLMPDPDRVIATVAGVRGVVSATPLIEGQVMATGNGQAVGAVARGMRPADLAGRQLIADGVVAGSLADLGPEDIVIGTRMADKLNLGLGDRLTLIAPQTTSTVLGMVPRQKAYRIGALFEVGMFEYDSSFIFLPLEQASLFFRTGDRVHAVEVLLEDPEAARPLIQEMYVALNGEARIFDWQRANQSFFNALQVERNVMFLILTLIVLVAAFNIVSSLIMMVQDKSRDIAVLRTMGAGKGTVMRVFVIAGAAVGIVGTAIGFALGLAFSTNIEAIRRFIERLSGTELFAAEIYFLSQLPAKVDPTEVIAVVIMGMVLSLIATLYPAWRAASIDPVEALRYE